ncbi:unnamed protein product [Rhizoctonia solani]|uniref:T6SS Phospholipase effector Tle1-like catalytic domain-containing protein n=1 Tax=Rhizoctonia solani TaxID=456999 RepID=A0A8H3DC48_9AGAM|nr:unnamed protein product [Rhizoctonia solani]
MSEAPTADTRQAGANLKPRTLVLCFDGTTNIFDETNTNVVKLFSLLERDNREKQMVYYQPGIGTYVPPGMILPITLKLAKIADQGIALYLDKHVMGGYEFLMKHYNHGDKICLFGFSRGAYTARALAGMLHKVGLLPPDNAEQIPFAYSMYKRSDDGGFRESVRFKKAFCRKVRVEFLGVWDTVSSVGLIPRYLPFTKSNPIVKTLRHAVSLDERRAKFKDHLWHVHSPGGRCTKPPREHESPKVAELVSPITQTPVITLQSLSKPGESDLKEAIDITVTEATPSTDCESSPGTAVGQLPLWGSPTDIHGQTHVLPPNKLLHPRERTHVEVPGSNLESEKPEHSGAFGIGHAPSSLCTKSGTILAPAVAPESDPAALGTNRAGARFLRRFVDWLPFRQAQGCQAQSHQAQRKDSCQDEYEAAMSAQCRTSTDQDEQETDVLEVWFAGGHGDIGGGAEEDNQEFQLSNISLRWMIRQIISSGCGIHFDERALSAMHISPVATNPSIENSVSQHSSLSDDAARKQEIEDACAELHDNLSSVFWWPLEFFPLLHVSKNKKGEKDTKIRFNFFRGRHPDASNGKIKVHKTVYYRMQNKPEYKYNARLDKNDIEWVD